MWTLTLLACRSEDPAPGDRAPEPHDSAEPAAHTAIPTPPGHTGLGGPTADTAPTAVVFDCDDVPPRAVSMREVDGPRGYHDLAFTDDGYVLGNTLSGALAKADAYGALEVIAPGTGTLEQLAWLPDGDLAGGSLSSGILRISLAGSVTTINPNVRPYGLVLGPDGMLWAADQRSVWVVDPVTGAQEEVVPPGVLPQGSPRVVAFDLTDSWLYIGTLSGTQGRIYRVPLDADFRPTAMPEVFATGVGRGGYHDAIGVDVCGYLYVPDYDTSNLYRVSPSGQVQVLLDSGFLRRDYGHGLEWGRGVGGFRDDALYLPQPYDGNRVLELVIGVPSRDWTGGTAIDLPPGTP